MDFTDPHERDYAWSRECEEYCGGDVVLFCDYMRSAHVHSEGEV